MNNDIRATVDGVGDSIILKEPWTPGCCAGGLPTDWQQALRNLSNKKAAPSSTVVEMASLVKTLLAGSLFAFASVNAGVVSSLRTRSGPVVTVKNGSYEGLYSSEYDQDFFLGMRYSQVWVIDMPGPRPRLLVVVFSLFRFTDKPRRDVSIASRALLPRTTPGLRMEWDRTGDSLPAVLCWIWR